MEANVYSKDLQEGKTAKDFDKYSKTKKLLFVIFFGIVVGGVYRYSWRRIYVALFFWFTAGFFLVGWVIDIVSVAKYGKIKWLVRSKKYL
jgi:hypothetical protein